MGSHRRRRQRPKTIMAIVQLTKYQQEAAQWTARFDLRRWCRQSGKTFEDTREEVDDCFSRRTSWVILSRGERQSKKNIEQARVHCEAYGAAAEVLEDTWEGEDGKYKSLEIKLPNGSVILGLPANPDTARGFSANVSLDEFAFHKDSRKIWAALFPVITRGYRLKVTSTTFGKQNKFYDLDIAWTKKMEEGDPHYHTSKLDIYDAVAGGLELRDEEGNLATPEQLKDALGDDDAWDQEYLVRYIDEATAYLTYDLIAKCEDVEIEPEPVWVGTLLARAAELHEVYLQTKEFPPSFNLLDETWINGEHLYLGFDVARRRHGSVIWLNRDRQGVQETVAVIRMKGLPFFIQKVVLFSLLSHPQLRRACIDATGLGMQLGEEAIEQFGESTVEAITFNTATKEVLATGLKQKMEDSIPRIPAETWIRNSFHAIKRLPTGAGHFRFDAEQTDATGHCYDAETEILTERGWQRFPDLDPAVRVATLEEGRLVFRMPEAHQRYPFSGEMVRIENTQVDLLVTPDHRLYVAKPGTDTFGFIFAKDAIRTNLRWQFKRDAIWTGQEPASVCVAGQDVSAALWAEFVGYYLAQGFTSTRHLCGVYGRSIETDRIGACLRRLPWHFWLEAPKSGGCPSFRARVRTLHEALAPFGRQPERYIPRAYFEWSPRLLSIMLDALLYGNGRVHQSWSLDTTSRQLADDVQELLLRVGLAGSIVEVQPSLAGKNVRRLYRVNINRHRLTPIINARKKSSSLQRYSGWTYCVTVPSGVIYVRRNGKGVWCSNSDEFWAEALALHAVSASGPMAACVPAADEAEPVRGRHRGSLVGAGREVGQARSGWRERFSRLWGDRSGGGL